MADDITIIVGGQSITGWTRIRLTRGIERLPADFEIELTEYYSGDNTTVVITPGAPCQVLLGGDLVLTGYVDEYSPSIDGENHIVNIYGRSKSEDIVDCSAEYPNAQIMSAEVLTVIQGLATTPYGIPVSQEVIPDETKNVIPQINFIYGETAVEVIDRICRYAKLLYYDRPDGGIVLTTASAKKAASGFTEGVNVQRATGRYTMNRYKEYRAVLVSMVQLSDGFALNSGQNNTANKIVTETDNTVQRNRSKYIVLESGDFDPFPITTARAIWEMNRRYGKAFEVEITTDGWRDSAGNLWEPNTLVDLQLPTLKIPQATWLIGEVTYSRDNSTGTTCTLRINPSCAYIPEPIVLVPSFAPDVGAGGGPAGNKNNPNITGVIQYPGQPSQDQLVTSSVDQVTKVLPNVGQTP